MTEKPAPLSPDQKRQARAQRREQTQEKLRKSREDKHRDWLLGNPGPADLTDDQKSWDAYKADQRRDRAQSRAVTVVVPELGLGRRHRRHSCSHRNKHHKASGRCRKSCRCDLAARRAAAKAKADSAKAQASA